MKLPVILLLLTGFLGAQTAPSSPASKASPTQSTKPSPSAGSSSSKQEIDPDTGSVTGNIYKSDYFGFSYMFPEQLTVQPDFMLGQVDEENKAFLLMAAYGSNGESASRQGVVILADKNADAAVKTGADYLNKMTREYLPAPRLSGGAAPARGLAGRSPVLPRRLPQGGHTADQSGQSLARLFSGFSAGCAGGPSYGTNGAFARKPALHPVGVKVERVSGRPLPDLRPCPSSHPPRPSFHSLFIIF